MCVTSDVARENETDADTHSRRIDSLSNVTSCNCGKVVTVLDNKQQVVPTQPWRLIPPARISGLVTASVEKKMSPGKFNSSASPLCETQERLRLCISWPRRRRVRGSVGNCGRRKGGGERERGGGSLRVRNWCNCQCLSCSGESDITLPHPNAHTSLTVTAAVSSHRARSSGGSFPSEVRQSGPACSCEGPFLFLRDCCGRYPLRGGGNHSKSAKFRDSIHLVR